MALFKIYRGNKTNLPADFHDGYAYFCADTGEFFIDVNLTGAANPTVNDNRVQVNAGSAVKLFDGTKTVEIDDLILAKYTIDISTLEDAGGVIDLTENAILLGASNNNIKILAATAGVLQVDEDGNEPTFDKVGVEFGGTGKTTLTTDAVLLGDGTNAVKEVAKAKGAFHSNGTAAPSYGTLPIDEGGTGATDAATARDADHLNVYSQDETYTQTETDTAIEKASAVSYTLTIATTDWIAPTGTETMYKYVWSKPQIKAGLTGDVPPLVAPGIDTDIDEYTKIVQAIATRDVGITFYAEEQPEADLDLIVTDHAK